MGVITRIELYKGIPHKAVLEELRGLTWRGVDVDEWLYAAGTIGIAPNIWDIPRDSREAIFDNLLMRAVLDSPVWGVVTRGPHVSAVFGAVASRAEKDVGYAWLVATHHGERHAPALQKRWREGLRHLHDRFKTLEAHPVVWNHLHIHWMLRLGFQPKVNAESYLGPKFIPFVRHRGEPYVLRSR